MLQTPPRQSNTMINTFKVCSYAASGTRCDWSADQILIHAINKKAELKAKYAHFNYIPLNKWEEFKKCNKYHYEQLFHRY